MVPLGFGFEEALFALPFFARAPPLPRSPLLPGSKIIFNALLSLLIVIEASIVATHRPMVNRHKAEGSSVHWTQ